MRVLTRVLLSRHPSKQEETRHLCRGPVANVGESMYQGNTCTCIIDLPPATGVIVAQMKIDVSF